MFDLQTIIVFCSESNQIVRAVNQAKLSLPLDPRKRLGDIFSRYLAAFGLEGTFERMNHRSVADIFAEYQPPIVREIASGEVDGVRYQLYDSPASDNQNSSTSESQPRDE